MTWQPIESAPKDGTNFLAAMAGPASARDCAWWVLHWNGHDFECVSSGNLILTGATIDGGVTHWMPLPDPPVSA